MAPTTSPDTLTVPREELLDAIDVAISDSLDVDWRTMDGARAVAALFDEYGWTVAAAPLPSECGGLGSSPAAMVSEIAAPHIKAAVRDGITLGLKMAIECLETAQPGVAAENQTWETALAVLAIVKADWKQTPPPSTPSSPGMQPLQAAECAQVPAPPGDKGGE